MDAPAIPRFSHVSDWTNAFIAAVAVIEGGRIDLEHIADWSCEVYPQHWRRDPAEVARELCAADDDVDARRAA